MLLIANPASGGGRARARVEALLADLALPAGACQTVFTAAPGDAARMAEEQAPAYDVLVAVGGDGTVGEVAGGLLAAGAAARLGILPLGTGNDFALTLGLTTWDLAVTALREGVARPVDVLETTFQVGDQRVTRQSLIGTGVAYPAEILTWATRRVKKVLGRWSYLYAALACAFAFRGPRLTVSADGETIELPALYAAVANLEMTAGHTARMAPGACLDDGLADLVLVRDRSILARLAMLPKIPPGRYEAISGVELRQVRHVQIVADPPARLNIDGDLIGTTPLTITVRPGALQVLVPGAG